MTDTNEVLIKWLTEDGKPVHNGRGKWPLPTRKRYSEAKAAAIKAVIDG